MCVSECCRGCQDTTEDIVDIRGITGQSIQSIQREGTTERPMQTREQLHSRKTH